jgi:peptide/nickel transport system permease protein
VIGVLTVLSIPVFARLTRSAVLRVREEPFVDAARCAGNSELRVMVRHVLPNSLMPALVLGSAICGAAILLTAGLSFIGAGVPAPTPEWGSMVSVGAPNLYTGHWWPALFPGIAIGLAVLCLSALGDALKGLLDPERR